jgi:hypothetical protein
MKKAADSGQRTGDSRTLPMVLRRMRPAIVTHRLETHTHLHLSPRLNFAVAGVRETGVLRVEQVLSGGACERVLRREEYVRELTMRGRRREEGPTGKAVEGSGVVESAVTKALPAVLVRSQVAVSAPAATVAGSNGSPFAARTAAIPQAAPVDVNRLTEQVIQQIDRRLQSYKERTGRR